jgi:hypothetical protein
MITVGCILEAHHRIPESEDIGDIGTPDGMQKLMEWGSATNRRTSLLFV